MKFIRYYCKENIVKYINIKLIKTLDFQGEKLKIVTFQDEFIRLEMPSQRLDSMQFDEFLNNENSVYDQYLQTDSDYEIDDEKEEREE